MEGQDLDAAARHLEQAILALGLDAESDPELAGTPRRLANFWAERFSGLDVSHPPEVRVLSTKGRNEDMILIKGLPFASTCAHHFTPFFGEVNMGYIPHENLMGVGTPARVVDYFSRRPQIQERLGENVAHYLAEALQPNGIMVHISARQFCMELRGAKSRGRIETTATRGWFSDQEWRSEFFNRLSVHPNVHHG